MDPLTRRALLFGVAAGLATTGVLVAYWLSVGALAPSDLGRALHSPAAAKQVGGIYLLGGLATAGVPAALYVRFGLTGPLLILGAFAALVGLASLGAFDGGDAPPSLFLLAFWPGYLAAYLVVGGLELWLRGVR